MYSAVLLEQTLFVLHGKSHQHEFLAVTSSQKRMSDVCKTISTVLLADKVKKKIKSSLDTISKGMCGEKKGSSIDEKNTWPAVKAWGWRCYA